MSKSNSEKIGLNIKDGLKQKATVQLGSLIDQNPYNLKLRNQLAQLYFDAGFFDAAGKFWILNDSHEPHIRDCVEIYEKSVNYSGNQILQDIKFKGERQLLDEYAKNKLAQLEADSLKKTNYIPLYKPKEKVFKQPVKNLNPIFKKLGCAIVILFFLSCVFSLVVGVKVIFEWLF